MIHGLLALVLMAATAVTGPDSPEQAPQLEIDPCVEVDESTVRMLMELQIQDASATHPARPVSVRVSCRQGTLEVRVEPWASLGSDGVRSIDLPAASETDSAARQARARELALAVAEVIRWLELTHPLASAPAAVPATPPPAAPAPAPPAPMLLEVAAARWQVGLDGAFEHFGGGQTLLGADLVLGARVARSCVSELRLGVRGGEDVDLPWVHVTVHAGTVSAALGLDRWSRRRRLGVALMGRAQGYLVDFQSAPAGPSNGGAARALALVVAIEPRATLAVTRHLSIATGAAAGATAHGIVVSAPGATAQSLTGLFLSATLGAVFTF